jgi:hypothetical protein
LYIYNKKAYGFQRLKIQKKNLYAVRMFGIIQLGVWVAMSWPEALIGPNWHPWREL